MKTKYILNQLYILIFMSCCMFFLNNYEIISFNSIQNYAKSNLNIRMVSQIYQGDLLTLFGKNIGVSNTEGTTVKSVVSSEQNLVVKTIGENVVCPIEGLVVKVTNNSVTIQGIDNNEYLFYDLDTTTISIYQYIYAGKKIGTAKNNGNEYYYQVCFNKSSSDDIYECLYYVTEYEEA